MNRGGMTVEPAKQKWQDLTLPIEILYVADLAFGNVSPGGIEPFFIAGGLGDGEVVWSCHAYQKAGRAQMANARIKVHDDAAICGTQRQNNNYSISELRENGT